MSDFFSDRNFFFFNIVPYSPGKEETLAADIIDYFEKTKNDTVLYCLSLHPEGFPAMEKAVQMAESCRKLKGLLEGTGVRLGVLIQSILGHWPRVDKENEPWTRSVIIDGRESRFCILDPGFRKYIFDVTAMVAKVKPVFILGDDDIRSFSLGKPECFCERHTAEFNAMTGLNFTPEEYREAVQKSTPGDKIFKTKDLSKQIGSSRLSFASGEHMERLLDITPGSCSILGLMNDREKTVRLLVDEDVLAGEWIGMHPCINTTSLKIRREDLFGKVLPAMEHDMTVVQLLPPEEEND